MRGLYEDVTQHQLAAFQLKSGIKCMTTGQTFKPDDKAVKWRCTKRHRWSSSYIDAQITGCPKCLVVRAGAKSLEVLGKNFQQTMGLLRTSHKAVAYFEAKSFPDVSWGNDAHHHLYFTDLLLAAIHLESWIATQKQLDASDSKQVVWKRTVTRKCCKATHSEDIDFSSSLRAIEKACSKNIKKLGLSKASSKKLRSLYRESRNQSVWLVKMRNQIAHGKAGFPTAGGKFNADLATFMNTLTHAKLNDFHDTLRTYVDLSDILIELGRKALRGNSKAARDALKATVSVSKHQIQSLTGIV